MPHPPIRNLLPAVLPAVGVAALLTLGSAGCGNDQDASPPPAEVTTTVPVTDTTVPPTPQPDPAPPPAPPAPPAPPDQTGQPPVDDPHALEAELAALRDAYANGFRQACGEIFGLSPTGRMSDPEEPGVEWTNDDCLLQLDDTMGEIHENTDQAYQAGREDGAWAADSLTFSGTLCAENGRCWTL